jgi:hypothetical protein
MRYGLFVAAPMSAFASPDGYARSRSLIIEMIEAISPSLGGQDVYYAGAAVAPTSAFTAPGQALDEDMGALSASASLLLIYPEKVATGALVELGYALARRIPVGILVRDHADLPYFLRDLRGCRTLPTTGPLAVATFAGDDDLVAAAICLVGELGLVA